MITTIRASAHRQPCEDKECKYCTYGTCKFGGFNVGLQCPQTMGVTDADMTGLANVTWTNETEHWEKLSTIWYTDEIMIAGKKVSGRYFLTYVSVMFGHHPAVFGVDIEIRDRVRSIYHCAICLSAGTSHDDKKFNSALEKKVEEFMGEVQPHLLAKYPIPHGISVGVKP